MYLKRVSLRVCAYLTVITILLSGLVANGSARPHIPFPKWKLLTPTPRSSRWLDEITTNTLLLSLADGTLMAVNMKSGQIRWSVKEDGLSFLTLTSSNNNKSAYILSSQGDLYRISDGIAERLPFDDHGHVNIGENVYSAVTHKETITMGINIRTGDFYYYCSPNSCFHDLGGGGGRNVPYDSTSVLIVRRIIETSRVVDLSRGKELIEFTYGHHKLSTLDSYLNNRRSSTSKKASDADDIFPSSQAKSLRYDMASNILYGFNEPESSQRRYGQHHQFRNPGECWNLPLYSPILSLWHSEVTSNSHILKNIQLCSILLVSGASDDEDSIGNHGSTSMQLDQVVTDEDADTNFTSTTNVVHPRHDDHNDINCYGDEVYLNLNGAVPFLHNVASVLKRPNFNSTKVLYLHNSKFPIAAYSLEVIGQALSPKNTKLAPTLITEPRVNARYLTDDPASVQAFKLKISWRSLSFRSYSGFFSDMFGDVDAPTPEFVLIVPLIAFWKEITFCASFLTLLLYFGLKILKCVRNSKRLKLLSQTTTMSSDVGIAEATYKEPFHVSNEASKDKEDSEHDRSAESGLLSSTPIFSRYKTDFLQISCIGHGGFGVVFKARNMVDDCLYAVKRVELPDCQISKEKVMREVKALAKLNHPGIIRFYNAWFEVAPENECVSSSSPRDCCCTDDVEPDCSTTTHDLPKRLDENNILYLGNNSVTVETSSVMTNTCCNASPSLWNAETPSLPTLPPLHQNRVSLEADDDDVIDFEKCEPKSEEPLWNDSTFSSSVESSREEEKVLIQAFNENDEMLNGTRTYGNLNNNRKIHLYIQMQLCHKQTLRTWLMKSTKGRDFDKALSIFTQILSAIDFIHSQGLMHRDLKPSNIFFAFDGTVKIGDFGLVTRIGSPISPSESVDPRQCTTTTTNNNNSNNKGDNSSNGNGVNDDDNNNDDHEGKVTGGSSVSVKQSSNYTAMVGTHLYMSPERLQGKPYDYKVDIFSMGLILFELLVPFGTQLERSKLIALAKQWHFPRALQESHPLHCELLRRMLHADPNKRPSASEIISSYCLMKEDHQNRVYQS